MLWSVKMSQYKEASQYVEAEVRWPSPDSAQKGDFRGHVRIRQTSSRDPAYYCVSLEGLRPNTLHGFHIHTNPVTSWDDLHTSCASCGGHFNPTDQEHGSVLNQLPHMRHAGDLINNVKADGFGRVCVNFWDDMAVLIPSRERPYTIIGKSLVVHEGIDDLGRQGMSPNMPYVYSKNIVMHGSDESEVVAYEDVERREGSLETGNAGSRLACGNIVPVAC